MIVLLLGCVDLDFASNNPPKLLAINGVAWNDRKEEFEDPEADELRVFPGEVFPIELTLEDPERHAIRVWWPRAPPGWHFDPDAAVGEWEVPDEIVGSWLHTTLVLQDTHADNPRSASSRISLWSEEIPDTGDLAGEL